MSSEEKFAALVEQLKSEGVRVTPKKGFFWEALHYIVVVVTLGGNRRFRDYYTTIGPVIGHPARWERTSAASRYGVLSHERVHVGQFRSAGLGSAWLGVLVLGPAYLLLPLPIGLAWCRWRLERVAYATGINARLEIDPSVRLRAELIDHAVWSLVGPAYAWTAWLWPGRARVLQYFEASVPQIR